VLRAGLVAEGVTVVEQARVAAVEPGPVLVLAEERRISGSHLLVAAGRVPNVDGLGLEAAGVRTTVHGIATDAGLRSLTNRRVYAAGDIADPAGIGPRLLTHVGSYHAGILARRILFRLPAKLDYRALPRVIYTDPELAQVGLTEAEAGQGARVVRWPFAENDRAIAEGRTEGMAKLVATKHGKLLGAGIAGVNAGEMIGLWTRAVAQRLPLATLAGVITPYPTRAEVPKRAASVAVLQRLFARGPRFVAQALRRLPW